MNNRLRKVLLTSLALCLFSLFGKSVYAQMTEWGGPYTADTNTVLLMHFDGNYDIASGDNFNVASEGVPHPADSVFLPDSSVNSNFGGSLYLNADTNDNVSIPDSKDLDMRGGWTMEAWARPHEVANRNKIFFKQGGDCCFWHTPYAMEFNDSRGQAYYNGPESGFTNTFVDIIETDRWYHILYVKDTVKNIQFQIVHDKNGNLIGTDKKLIFGENQKNFYEPDTPNRIAIGLNPHTTDPDPTEWTTAFHSFEGNIDEIRLSNRVREFSNLQVAFFDEGGKDQIHKPTITPKQDSITFALDSYWYGPGDTARTVNLHWNSGSGWQSKEMANVDTTRYSTKIENFQGGTTVDYFVTSDINGDTKGVFPKEAGVGTGNNLTLKVEFLPQRVYKLSFEEASGEAPIDSSSFEDTARVSNSVSYNSNVAKDGSQSYDLNSSTELFVPGGESPQLAGFEVTVDLWFRPNSAPSDSARLIAKESATDSSLVNYSIFFKDGELRARATGAGDVELDSTLQTGTWYRAVYMIDKTAHSLQLWDDSGNLIEYDVESISGQPLRANDGPLFIGQGNFYPDSAFDGQIDKLVMHNFPSVEGPFVVKNVDDLFNRADTASSYPVSARIHQAGKGEATAELHYKGKFGWTFLEMDLKDPQSGDYLKSITKQPPKTAVPYFVTVESGPYTEEVPTGSGANVDSTNFHVGIYKKHTKVLDLDFEETVQGTTAVLPVDQSTYSMFNTSSAHSGGPQNTPEISTDAVQGDNSIRFALDDSSSITVDSRGDFLDTDEITVSYWFKVNQFDPALGGFFQKGHIVSNASPFHCCYGFMSWFNGSQHFRAATWTQNQFLNGGGLKLPHDIEKDKWYQVHYEQAMGDTAFTQVRDINGEVLFEVGTDMDPGAITKWSEPLTIGAAYPPIESNEPQFDGWIDDVEIYNYAATAKPPTVENVTNIGRVKPSEGTKTVEADVDRNGDEPVVLHYRGYHETSWDTAHMTVDFTGTHYTAELPSNKIGDAYEYFVSSTNDFGTTTTSPADTSGDNFHEAIYRRPNSVVLNLQFEEGSGAPKDSSIYNHDVMLKGWGNNKKPQYAEAGSNGQYALEFSAEDSTYLEVISPVLASKQYTIDLWFKMKKTDNSGVRLISKEANSVGPFMWNKQNYEIRGLKNGSWTAGAFHPDSGVSTVGEFTNTFKHLTPEDSVWYHARLVRKSDTTSFTLFDSNGNFVRDTSTITGVEEIFVSTKAIPMKSTPALTEGPLRIGHSGPGDQPFFDGWVDQVVVRNYARSMFTDIERGNKGELPEEFALGHNYPNPFNPTTTIEYSLPQATDVKIAVYNILGRQVETLVNSNKQAGKHQVKFDAGNLASGVYFYRIETPEFQKVRKMMLVK